MNDPENHVLSDLSERGFAAWRGIGHPAIVDRMRRAAERLAVRPTESWDGARKWLTDAVWRPSHFAGAGDNRVLYDCLGMDDDLDRAIDAFIATPAVRRFLDQALGDDHRMWFVQLRWAEPGGPEYRLHQDVYGEVALCLYLSDHPDAKGSVVFWPGSHRWPRIADRLPNIYPATVPGNLASVEGVAGDVCVFLNKTWHGRTSAIGTSRLVFLISFIPPGPIEKYRRLPESARRGLGPRLRHVTAPDRAPTFGDRPPNVTPFSSRFETLSPDELRRATDQLQKIAADWSPMGAEFMARALQRFGPSLGDSITSGPTAGR